MITLNSGQSGMLNSQFNGLWDDVVDVGKKTYQAGKEFILVDLPAAAAKTAKEKAVGVVQPIVEAAAAKKAASVSAKGQVALLSVAGAALAGTLAWKRWYIGAPIGALVGAAVGWKIGWLSD